MLKKKERLTKRQFDRFFSSGKRSNSPLLGLTYTSHESFHGAVVVGKKVYKKAVDRNKMRRRLYSLLYNLKEKFNLKVVYIITTKSTAKDSTYSELKDQLIDLVGKLEKTG